VEVHAYNSSYLNRKITKTGDPVEKQLKQKRKRHGSSDKEPT
jgi:hypothetical protein